MAKRVRISWVRHIAILVIGTPFYENQVLEPDR
jgi:hypothetical protein